LARDCFHLLNIEKEANKQSARPGNSVGRVCPYRKARQPLPGGGAAGRRPLVGKQLAALEANLGVRLMQCSARRLTLTEAGERVLSQAESFADALDAVAVLADELLGQVKGHLRVTCSSGLGKVILLPLLNGFYERYPKWRLSRSRRRTSRIAGY